MSIQSEIDRLSGAKEDIVDAIEARGGTVEAGATLEALAAAIESIPDSDEKVALTVFEPRTNRYLHLPFDTISGATPTDRDAAKLGINDGIRYYGRNGTAAQEGRAYLSLGNDKAVGTEGNKTGGLYIYSDGEHYYTVRPASITANSTITLPPVAGRLLVKSGTSAVGDASTPVYITANGVATKCGFSIKMGTAEPESAGLNDGDLYFKYS